MELVDNGSQARWKRGCHLWYLLRRHTTKLGQKKEAVDEVDQLGE